MKKKVLLSSIATIALCLCLIAGSTFALFTSKSEVGIAVTAAKVEMTANISNLEIYSVKASSNGAIVDEMGGTYIYNGPLATFANGGTATFDNTILTLDRITPGDKVSFNVEGANTSDVIIQYRYVIECVSGEKLMSGLLVTIEETTYPILSKYTSAWKTLQPGNDIDSVPVVIELPVKAGNEYQAQTTEIKVTVEAVQGNADVKGAKPVVEFLDGYTANLDEQTLTDAVVNYDNVGIENGTIVLDSVGVENYGEATLTDMTITAGTSGTQAYGYAFISREGSTSVLDNVTVNSANGAIGVVGGAELTFDGGYVEVDSKSTSGRYLFYVVDEGSVATINDGTFYFNKTQNQKRAYAYVGEGATLYITGGTFGTASTRSGYTAGLLGDGDIIITGGTFGFDPTTWVADGYKAEKDGANWVVSPMANDTASLNEAIASGEEYIVLAPGSYKFPTTLKAGMTLECAEGTVFEGNSKLNINGATIIGATFSNPTGTAADQTINGVFKNCTFTGVNGLRWAYAGETVVFENCVFDGSTYGVHFDGGANEVIFRNCTFSGFNALGGAITKVTMENCTFKANGRSIYNGINMWCDIDMIGCTFEFEGLASYEWLDLCGADKTATFTNCVMSDGRDLSDVVTKRHDTGVIIIDGVEK